MTFQELVNEDLNKMAKEKALNHQKNVGIAKLLGVLVGSAAILTTIIALMVNYVNLHA